MSNFLFFGVLRALGRGSAVRKWMTLLLRGLSILTLILGGYILFQGLASGFREGAPSEAVLLTILTLLILAVTIVAMAQIFWFRANSVNEIPEGPFTAIPVFAVLVRAIGEVYACVIAAAGLFACLGIWIARHVGGEISPLRLPGFNLPNLPLFENSFFQGVLILVVAMLIAAAYLLFFYFFAEAIVVTVDIAINVRALVRGSSPAAVPAAPQYAPQAQPQYIPAPAPTVLRCPNCGNENPAGTTFCVRCGASLVPPGS